mmetsp:Transcript_41998/g.125733  ORF Transcript_41998/g.125733 Transcript_41998/m.125733 type:complete len:217 (+) Transcript_41998:541-1191(+)
MQLDREAEFLMRPLLSGVLSGSKRRLVPCVAPCFLLCQQVALLPGLACECCSGRRCFILRSLANSQHARELPQPRREGVACRSRQQRRRRHAAFGRSRRPERGERGAQRSCRTARLGLCRTEALHLRTQGSSCRSMRRGAAAAPRRAVVAHAANKRARAGGAAHGSLAWRRGAGRCSACAAHRGRRCSDTRRRSCATKRVLRLATQQLEFGIGWSC